MSRKSQTIRAVDGDGGDTDRETPLELTAEIVDHAEPEEFADEITAEGLFDYVDHDEAARPNRLGLIAGVLCALAMAGWTGLYLWSISAEPTQIGSAAPAQWARWIIDWSVPVLLVCVVWILTMRNSTREAGRFAASAALLSKESAQLEKRLTVVNRELSLAREFLASQSRDLETLGRVAAERLSGNAAELQDLIKGNGEQVETIGTASETALANMTRLRDDLPVIANSARDVNNQVGTTGRTAHEQLDKLVAGFERLNAFGKASETQVNAIRQRVGETITGFETQLERIENALTTRFETMRSETECYRGAITATESEALSAMNERIALLQAETRAVGTRMREAEGEALEQVMASKARWESEITAMVGTLDTLDRQAVDASQRRIMELHEEAGRFDDKLKERDTLFLAEMSRRQDDFDKREADAAETMTERLAQLDATLDEKRKMHVARMQELVEGNDTISAQLDRLSETIARIEELGSSTRTGLGEGLDALDEQLEAKRSALIEMQATLTKLTDLSVRLLEIIQSGAKHSREELSQAIEAASLELGGLETRAEGLSGSITAIGEKGDELSSYLIRTGSDIDQTNARIEALQAKVAERSDEALAKLNGLRGALRHMASDSEAFASETQEALLASIAKLEEATKAAITALDEGANTQITGLADRISKEAVTAFENALNRDSQSAISELQAAASQASGASREATVQLHDQLVHVNELTGNLEKRVAHARQQAEEQLDNDFSRRMALLTDSLNSVSIDISKAMSTEVADTAWDAYLKGDRGIFTRRAVRLLDNTEARAVTELYQADETFRGNVNRYIHDFEAMLRSMLSTRDGNALSVTMLGSDIGKLYVALAQSIERLRK